MPFRVSACHCTYSSEAQRVDTLRECVERRRVLGIIGGLIGMVSGSSRRETPENLLFNMPAHVRLCQYRMGGDKLMTAPLFLNAGCTRRSGVGRLTMSPHR